jgi:DHA2 family multidrug resistance protein-like MFS transporter
MGGLLLDYFWWGAVFLINVPIAIVLLLTSPLLPEFRNNDAKRLDVVSVLLSSLALVALVFGLQEMANVGFNMLYGGAVVIGIATGILFIKRQMNTVDPLLDLRMFRISTFTVSLIALMLIPLVTMGGEMLFAQHLQSVVGFSPTEAGLLLIIPALLAMAGTLISPVLTRWMRPAYAMVSGLLTAAGGALLIMLTAHDAGALILIIGASLVAFGKGPAMTIASEKVMSSVPHERAGSASGMTDVSTGLGYALSIAFIGSLGMLVYRGALASSIPTEMPSEIVNSAMESVGAAVEVTEGFPEMLQVIQSSFTTAIQFVYGIAAIGLFVIMMIIVWKLRHVSQEDTTSAENEKSS